MNEELLEQIGELAEQLDNSLVMYKNGKGIMPDAIHLIGLSGTMKDVRNNLVKIYKKNGGTEKLDIQG